MLIEKPKDLKYGDFVKIKALDRKGKEIRFAVCLWSNIPHNIFMGEVAKLVIEILPQPEDHAKQVLFQKKSDEKKKCKNC